MSTSRYGKQASTVHMCSKLDHAKVYSLKYTRANYILKPLSQNKELLHVLE